MSSTKWPVAFWLMCIVSVELASKFVASFPAEKSTSQAVQNQYLPASWYDSAFLLGDTAYLGHTREYFAASEHRPGYDERDLVKNTFAYDTAHGPLNTLATLLTYDCRWGNCAFEIIPVPWIKVFQDEYIVGYLDEKQLPQKTYPPRRENLHFVMPNHATGNFNELHTFTNFDVKGCPSGQKTADGMCVRPKTIGT